MSICLLGQNHKTAPIELRERLALSEKKRDALCALLREDQGFRESTLLSTCNRMELYAVSRDSDCDRERLGRMLEKIHGIALSKWESTLYYRQDDHAIRHLFRVASGLDSMVLGEGQILSQVKDAHLWASEHDLAHDVLHRAFDEAVACGKRVRTQTRVSEGAVSVASAAVSLARQIFEDLSEEAVLLIGAGDTGARVARHLQLFGVRDLRVTNRTRSRSEKLAGELDATLVPWHNLDDHLSRVSIVVTAVSSSEPVLDRERMRAALKHSRRRAVFVIDLAVPRNVHPDVGKIAGLFLYNVDDLQGIVLEDEDQRRHEAAKGEEIVDESVRHFLQWYNARAAGPTVAALRHKMETLRQAELDLVRNRLDERSFAELDRVTRRLMNKILHPPTTELRRRSMNGSTAKALEDFRALFALDDEPDQ